MQNQSCNICGREIRDNNLDQNCCPYCNSPLFVILPSHLAMHLPRNPHFLLPSVLPEDPKELVQFIKKQKRCRAKALLQRCTKVKLEDLSDQTSECAICQYVFQKRRDIRNLPCGHLYHRNCIEKWFLEKDSCPSCRYIIK